MASTPPETADAPVALGLGVSPAEMVWRKWLLLGGLPAVGVVVLVGLCTFFFWPDAPQTAPPGDQTGQPDAANVDVPTPTSVLPAGVDRRWLPDGTSLWFSLHPSQLAGEPGFGRVIDQIGGRWDESAGAVMRGLGLKPELVRRLTWAATDLAAWPEQSVIRIELEPGYDPSALTAAGEPIDLELAGVRCRRLADTGWDHPLAVIDRQTIVTGQETLLRHLATRDKAHLESATLERLLPLAGEDAELTLLVDLAAARRAGWRLPTAVLDVWPEGMGPWHVAWETSDGLGCRWQAADGVRSEMLLVCAGPTAAERVDAALDELIPAAGKWLAGQVETLARQEPAPETASPIGQYERLLKQGLAATEKAQWKVIGTTVWVGIDWGEGPTALASAAIDGRPAIRAEWLAAARRADESHYRQLLGGLEAHDKSEGHAGSTAIGGGARLPPEERLSWIATMLPYLDHEDWCGQLDFAETWNGPSNRAIAERPLPEVVNPAVGPSRTEAGFPVTHYVGVAGVGPDAAGLDADDPRAGVFGNGRRARADDIPDGAANTIAVLGVTGDLGPWASGGSSTVRPLTKAPYINGPDGFGSGQPDGMLAGMADGSVRFLSKDIDPRVLEQMATVNGQRDGEVAVRPGPELPQPGADPTDPGPDPADESPDDSEAGGPVVPSPDESPARAGPIRVDVAARLADPLPEIQLHDEPLAAAVDLLSGLSTVPMTFDPEAMQQLGVTLRDPVSVDLSGATMGEALHRVLASRGMAVAVEDGQVLLTSPADQRERLWSRRYTVTDLAGERPADVAALAALVQKLVTPDSWRPSGGRGTLEVDGGVLVVTQTGTVHDQILTFCERLRVARGKPLRSRLSPDRFALLTRTDRAKATLSRPVTANFHEPTPLVEVLGYLGQLAEADILVDRLALNAAGTSDQAAASVAVVQQPLGDALDALLRPLGLQYRVVDAQTLQVTTSAAVAARLELEFYRVDRLLAADRTGPAVAEQIKDRLAGATWSDAGGPGVIDFDPSSRCLIVLQSQPVQRELERLLGEL